MKRLILLIAVLSAGCLNGPAPADIRVSEDACAHCRMTLVTQRTAAQIVAPGEDPLIFDEVGCLRDYLASRLAPFDARVFVADHNTGEWIDATTAVFTKTALTTPMATGLIAHANRASRDADPAAEGGEPVDSSAILHPSQVRP